MCYTVLFLAFCLLQTTMKFIIGYKQEMTQQYREDGTVVPVTIVKAEPAVVTQVKNTEKDGYQSVQIGIGTRNKVGKSQAGHLKTVLKDGRKPFHRLQEVRVEDASGFQVGDTITVKTFAAGDKVAVTGRSKGKGFQGVVKRHNFGGSPASHGHKDQLRMPGSIGAQDPQRVFKGMKMAGRMGGDRITVKNLEIVSLDEENNLLFVKGALPGARNSMIMISGEGELVKGASIFEAPKAEEPKQEEKAEETESKEDPAQEVKEEKKEEEKSEPTEEATEKKEAEQASDDKESKESKE